MTKYALTDVLSDLLGQPINERNQNAIVRCPIHGERRPSLSFNLDTGLWICFACGARGNVYQLAAALNATLDMAGVALKVHEAGVRQPYIEEEPHDFSELAKEQRANLYAEKPSMLVEWLASRGISGKVVRHFGLGWSNGRISFPYYDGDICIGIKYRDRTGYKTYEPGSRRGIYNINDVRFKPDVFIMEGESDTLAMWTHLTDTLPADRMSSIGVGGFPGTGASSSQWETQALDLLWAKRVWVCYDADDAGDKGAEVVMRAVGDKAIRLRPTMGTDYNEHFMNGGTLNAELD
jgi:CHC2-type zinc finger protein/Toprim domain-containing protein